MAVLRPLRVVIENYPEGQVEEVDVVNNPEDPSAGTRKVPFSRVLYIERDDFREDPPKKFFRLAPGREVRLRYAYFITCTGVVKDGDRRGHRAALHLRSGDARRRRARRPQGEGDAALGLGRARGRRRGAALRPAVHHRGARRRAATYRDDLNPASLEVIADAKVEPSARRAAPGARFQFERLGYFCVDPDTTPEPPGLQPHRDAEGQLGEGRKTKAEALARARAQSNSPARIRDTSSSSDFTRGQSASGLRSASSSSTPRSPAFRAPTTSMLYRSPT